MKNIIKLIGICIFITALPMTCKSQDKSKDICSVNRQPVAAGKFYEFDKDKLQNEINDYFKSAVPKKFNNVLAIISPHAGYVFSGKVAASAFNQVNIDTPYERVFILSPSHYFAIDGAAIYNQGNFITPLGQVEVDCDLANDLISKYPVFKSLPQAHQNEHAIEVQLPFLQTKLKKGYKIVPIVIGTQDNNILRKISDALKEYLNPKNLFVISSDFSHYPNYQDANKIDNKCGQAIAKNSPKELSKVLEKAGSENMSGLATCMCGEAGIMCLLNMSSKMQHVRYELIEYKNSGDSKYGDKNRVVGYWAIALISEEQSSKSGIGFELNHNEKEILLSIARKTLDEYIKNNKIPAIDTTGYSNTLKTKCGAFVTLTSRGQLRGCIGSFGEDKPVYQVVQEMAISASSNDPRFTKVKSAELKNIKIEISVLSPMHKIDSISQVKIGTHGIYIKKGYKRGTLLPQVAPDNNWNSEQFVKYCAVYKAGIDESEIKNSELYVYEAIVFKEKEKD